MVTSDGYQPTFLPVDVTLPAPLSGDTTMLLPYVHFSVILDLQRKLPVVTGVNISGSELQNLGRGDDWHLDPRVSVADQAGPAVYSRNDLDRGHQVRRRDPVWGSAEVAEAANEATFVYTNAAPQAAEFNQSAELWAGLEDYVLGYARASEQKISVFTAPVLADDDPPYRGILIPRQFWKIAAWVDTDDNQLRASGYILDQTPELASLPLRTAEALAAGQTPPLGPFRTYQVPIADITRDAHLELGVLEGADVFERIPVGAGRVSAARAGWRLLESTADITL